MVSFFKKSHLGPGPPDLSNDAATTYNDTREINKVFVLHYALKGGTMTA